MWKNLSKKRIFDTTSLVWKLSGYIATTPYYRIGISHEGSDSFWFGSTNNNLCTLVPFKVPGTLFVVDEIIITYYFRDPTAGAQLNVNITSKCSKPKIRERTRISEQIWPTCPDALSRCVSIFCSLFYWRLCVASSCEWWIDLGQGKCLGYFLIFLCPHW